MPWLKPSISSEVAVYKDASNDDIYTAFKEIAGIRTLPSTGSPRYQTIKGKHLYVVNQVILFVYQSKMEVRWLRNFSLSQYVSKARFTIEIQKSNGQKVMEIRYEN